jgi:WD40 repeat protein
LWDAARGTQIGQAHYLPTILRLASEAPVYLCPSDPNAGGKLPEVPASNQRVRVESDAPNRGSPLAQALAPYLDALEKRSLITAPFGQGPVFSPGDRYLVTGGQLWQTATGNPAGEPLRHGPGTPNAVLLPDSKSALTINGDLRIWDLALHGPRREFRLGVEAPPGKPKNPRVALSPDGRTLAVWDGLHDGPGTSLRLWAADTGVSLAELPHPTRVRTVAFSPDGKTLVTVCGRPAGKKAEEVRRWDVTTGKLLGEPMLHDDLIYAVAFTPDGKTIVTGGWELRRWDAATGKKLTGSLRLTNVIQDIVLSPDGRTILTRILGRERLKDEARLWDAVTCQPIGGPLKHKDGVHAVAFTPDGKTALTAGADPITEQRGEFRLWDAATGLPVRSLPYRHPVHRLSYSPDGKAVLMGGPFRGTMVLDAATWKPLLPEPISGGPRGFSPDGRMIRTQDQASVRLWDAATGKQVGPAFPHPHPVAFAAFRPDGKTLLTVSDNRLRLWNIPVPVSAEVERLRLWVEVNTGLELDASGVVVELDAQTWQQRWRRLNELGGLALPK